MERLPKRPYFNDSHQTPRTILKTLIQCPTCSDVRDSWRTIMTSQYDVTVTSFIDEGRREFGPDDHQVTLLVRGSESQPMSIVRSVWPDWGWSQNSPAAFLDDKLADNEGAVLIIEVVCGLNGERTLYSYQLDELYNGKRQMTSETKSWMILDSTTVK